MTARLNPWLAFFQMVEAGAVPLETYPGTMTPWRCLCLGCGEIVTPQLFSIRAGQGTCRPCSQRRRRAREWAEAEPQAVADMEAAGATPVEPFPGLMQPWRCECHGCGEIVTPRLSSILRGRGPCGPCSNRRRWAHELAEAEAQAIADMEAAGATPVEPYPGAHRPWRCRCHGCGEIVTPRLGGIRGGQGPCKPCGDRRAVVRQLAEAEPQASAEMEAAGATPVEPYPGAERPWRCECHECGRIVTPRLNSIRAGQGPCRPCAYEKHTGGAHVARDIAAQTEPGAEEPGDKRSPWTPGVLYLLRLRWEDGSSMLKLGTAYAHAYGERRRLIAKQSNATVEIIDEWAAPRVICDWLEQQHHRAGREALARWKASPVVAFAGQHECYADTPWMLGRLRASVARWATVVPGYSDHGPDVDPLEIHAMHYDTEAHS